MTVSVTFSSMRCRLGVARHPHRHDPSLTRDLTDLDGPGVLQVSTDVSASVTAAVMTIASSTSARDLDAVIDAITGATFGAGGGGGGGGWVFGGAGGTGAVGAEHPPTSNAKVSNTPQSGEQHRSFSWVSGRDVERLGRGRIQLLSHACAACVRTRRERVSPTPEPAPH